MRKRVISILGCGWFGKALGQTLTQAGYSVMGTTTKVENINEIQSLGISAFVLNVGELSDQQSEHPIFKADVVVISLPHRTAKDRTKGYIDQVSTAVHAAKTAQTKNLILISTTSVYPNLNRVVTEEDADSQNSIVMAERIVLDSGIQSTIVRFAGLFGPGRNPGNFLANKDMVAGGNVPVNLIHLEDCIEIIKRIIENNVWDQVLNACADEHPTRKIFYTNASRAIGVRLPVFSDDPGEYKIVSNDRLKRILKYDFIHQL